MSPALSVATVAGLFLAVASLERVPALRFAPAPFLRRHLGTDAAWYLIATTANVIGAFVLLPALSRLALPGVAGAVVRLPWPGRFALAVVLYDFAAFAVHIWLHRSETLWAFHKVHHSSLQLDWLATTRAHMLENLVRQVAAQVPLFAVGLTATTVAPALVVYAAFAVYGHSNLRSGRRLEAVFVTPRLHRLHHVPATTQTNLATIFNVWDRLFSRFSSLDVTSVEPVGVPGELDTYPQTLGAALRRPFAEVRGQGMGRLAAPAIFD
jgi:lathosterol oxidase